MTQKTVLLLHCGGDGIRGTEVCLVQTAKALTKAGFKVIVCRNSSVMDPVLNDIAPPPVITEMVFPELMLDGRRSSLPVLRYLRALKSFYRLVKESSPCCIYCSGGLPCQLAVPIARLCGIPVLCHFHHPDIKRAYYLWLVKLADCVVFPSQFTKHHSIQKAGVDGTVIYNGIDVHRFQPQSRDPTWRQQLGIPADAIVIGQVAQLTAHKRPELLIQAYSQIRERCIQPLHLCLVGKGPLETSLRALVSNLHLENEVTITGYVDDVLPFYQHVFDINVLVSREEGLGISSIEGAACGLPVVVARGTGLTETIIEDVSGLSFGIDDIEDLCDKLLLLIAQPCKRRELGINGRRLAIDKFAGEAYNVGITATLEKLISSPTGETQIV